MPASRSPQARDRRATTSDVAISARARPSRGVSQADPAVSDWLKPHDRPSRPRRSPKLIAIGILCACLGGLGAAFAWTSVTTAHPVIVAQRAVAKGDVIKPGDFGLADVAVTAGVATLPASDLPGMIGERALIDLPQGSLVGPAAVGALKVPAGESVVGLSVSAGRAPVNTLPYGAEVTLLRVVSATQGQTQGDNENENESAPIPPWTVQARVVATSVTNPDGTVLVDVALPHDDALIAAMLSAQGELALVRMGG